MYTISKSFTIEAAHYLEKVPATHKCSRVHGHSFRFTATLSSNELTQEGWVRDFADIKREFYLLKKMMDHQLLNKIKGLENPTSENIAKFVFDNLKDGLPELQSVRVAETCDVECEYFPEK